MLHMVIQDFVMWPLASSSAIVRGSLYYVKCCGGPFLYPGLDCSCRTVAQWFWGRRVGTGSIETYLKPACA